ncbi:MAG: hypothetical protein AAF387_17500 [Pseudomonadota bacterium]
MEMNKVPCLRFSSNVLAVLVALVLSVSNLCAFPLYRATKITVPDELLPGTYWPTSFNDNGQFTVSVISLTPGMPWFWDGGYFW